MWYGRFRLEKLDKLMKLEYNNRYGEKADFAEKIKNISE